jgi:PST family polysaccharide transporter
LQGLRRLRDLATSQILGTAFGAVVSVALVWWLREKGIVPYLVAISAFGVILSWWYARRVPVQRVPVTWRETLVVSRSLLVLGVAFTVSPLISSSSAYLIRILIQHQLGMEAVGIYTATWTLSIYYIGFVVTAMGTDFLPRLSAANNDHAAMNRMVNEQIEMGVLVAVPGVLVTVTLAPWVITMLYSGSFVQGAEMVRWQILGIFLRVVSWPLNCILIAKGKSLWFLLGELVFGVTYVGSVLVCLKLWKLEGLGMAFALTYLTYTTLMLLMAWRLTEFHWSATALKILVPAVLIMGAIFGCTRFLPVWWSVSIGLAATVVAGLASLQVLQKLLGVNLLARIRSKLPWAEETN